MAKLIKLPKIKKNIKSKKDYGKELDTLWSLAVRHRDGCCQICGNKQNIQAHHIISRKHLSTRWEVTNGITLCYFHHIHGVHKDTVVYAMKILEWLGENEFNKLRMRSNAVLKMSELYYLDKKKELESIINEVKNYEW